MVSRNTLLAVQQDINTLSLEQLGRALSMVDRLARDGSEQDKAFASIFREQVLLAMSPELDAGRIGGRERLDSKAMTKGGAYEVERILEDLSTRLPHPLRQTDCDLNLHDADETWVGKARIE